MPSNTILYDSNVLCLITTSYEIIINFGHKNRKINSSGRVPTKKINGIKRVYCINLWMLDDNVKILQFKMNFCNTQKKIFKETVVLENKRYSIQFIKIYIRCVLSINYLLY